ncbi:unnamed protein product [Phytophthora fragariaefolia]|uniref:Unnamed protein product n=1 Tax=Phytophthora fragariaefolia TaxID=1490495 RepID=A0A9W7CRK0_9STRA|nr:unnamed protein product [Phytophthora fragariaefolia]
MIDPGSPKINDTDRDSQGATPPWPHSSQNLRSRKSAFKVYLPKKVCSRKAEQDAKAAEDKAKSTEPAAQDDRVSTEAAGEEDLRSESKTEGVPE